MNRKTYFIKFSLLSLSDCKMYQDTQDRHVERMKTANEMIKILNENCAYMKKKRSLCTMDTLGSEIEKKVHDKACIVIEQFTSRQHTCRFIFADNQSPQNPKPILLRYAPVFDNDLMLCIDSCIIPFLGKKPESESAFNIDQFKYDYKRINRNIIMIRYGLKYNDTCIVMFHSDKYCKDTSSKEKKIFRPSGISFEPDSYCYI
jgi:hypothetical protein